MTEPESTEAEQTVEEAIEAGDVTAEEVAEAEVDDQTGEGDSIPWEQVKAEAEDAA